jgi:catechol 2,3-dioxygenase-like lactoylglutathione lyase family enzyme
VNCLVGIPGATLDRRFAQGAGPENAAEMRKSTAADTLGVVTTVPESEARDRANVRVGSIVIRCVRFEELVAFWQAALGYVPREPPEDGWVVLTDPNGAGPNISFDRVAEGRLPRRGELSRVHLDLYTADQPAEVERLLGLGATRFERDYGEGEDFVVLVDPDGNRFCVVDKAERS